MATSFTIQVRSDRPRKDGSYGIRIALTHNGTKRYIPTPWSIAAKYYRNNRITDRRIDDLTQSYLRELRQCVDVLGVCANSMTADEVLTYCQRLNERNAQFELDFIAYTRAYVEYLRKKEKETYRPYLSAINSFASFFEVEQMDISLITSRMLQRWVDWLKDTTKGGAPRLYKTNLQAMFERARKEFNDEDNDIIHIRPNPFKRVVLPQKKMARKRALEAETIRAIANASDKRKCVNYFRDMFILSFCLCGMNMADLYEVPASAYQKGRLTYCRKKTRDRRADNAEISIKVEPEAEAIIEKYRDPKGEYLLNLKRKYSDYRSVKTTTVRLIHNVGSLINFESLTFYAARHSWATIATNDCQIDKYTVHEALNHVDPTMAITDIYIKKDFRNVDIANRKVLDYVFGNSQ